MHCTGFPPNDITEPVYFIQILIANIPFRIIQKCTVEKLKHTALCIESDSK